MRCNWQYGLICLSILLIQFQTLAAQNLLPDGDFEELSTSLCKSPSQQMFDNPYWYPLEATPDLFIKGCPINTNGSFFWDASLSAYSGKNFAGLNSRWNSNGTYVAEGIATPLTQPLKAGTPYFLEFAVRNRGAYEGAVNSASLCALNPDRHIDIYGHTDSIFVFKNTSNGTSTTNAHLLKEVRSQDLDSKMEGKWEVISACFVAQGGERFVAIMMPLGTFGPLPACASTQASSGVFHSFYFNIDSLSLIELPKEIVIEKGVCEFEELEVNLLLELDFSLKNEATYVWEDGFMGPERRLPENIEYRLEAQFDCGRVPIIIKPQVRNCNQVVYMPTAFSPNGDGLNDSFSPFFDPTFSVERFDFRIYNRWGRIVFQTNDPTQAWTANGQRQAFPEGAYIWKLDCTLGVLGQNQRLQKSGSVLLMR
ncbi:MAG: gliding motility-associated C-terminal domain-containing protein [Bacteroidota bacterium]